MADVSHVITLGIGTPADIAHFILVGLSPTGVVSFVPFVLVTGSVEFADSVVANVARDSVLTGDAARDTTLAFSVEID